MSLRDKAREVKSAGESERGNFTPHGVPLRIYQWWLSQSKSKRARAIRAGRRRENFCHFWRVVLFWAPLRKVAQGFNKIAPYLAVLVLIAAVVVFVWGLIVSQSMLIFVLQALGMIAAIASFVVGLIGGTAIALGEERQKRADLPPLRYSVPFAIFGLPTAIVAFIITKAIIFDGNNLSLYNKQIGFSALGLLALVVVLGIGSTAGWFNMIWIILGFAALIVLALLVVFMISLLADYISGKRSLAKTQAAEAREKFLIEHGHYPFVEPGRVAKFFSGAGDFIVLLAQVVRVNKWKICPLVEINETN